MTDPAADPMPEPKLRTVPLSAPFAWLSRGWGDFIRVPGASLLHGILVALGGVAVLAVARGHFYLVSGAFSGFVLVAPVLATGLYELSRRLADGRDASLADAISAWGRAGGALAGFGLVLMVIGTFWVLVSSVMIALFVQAPVTGFEDFLRYVVLSRESNLFVVWMAAGGVVAALVFAASVVSVPLLLDRDVDFITAMITSVQTVLKNPRTMISWGLVVAGLLFLSLLPAFLGLFVTLPVLGHATWHLYRRVVLPAG